MMETPWTLAVGWALLHSLWQGAAVALMLAALMAATRNSLIRYWSSCAALLLMLAVFGVTLNRLAPTIGGGTGLVKLPPVPRVDLALPLSIGDAPSLDALLPWLSLLWIGGVSVFYLRHLAGWASVGRLRRRGVCAVSIEWQARLDGLLAKLQVPRPVRLMESCFVDAPIVLGHFRPVILVPLGLLAGLPSGQLEAILLHELAHIRRHDYLVNLIQRLVEGLFFYHPAVWWISYVIRSEREHCCDDIAVAMSGDAHAYASALAELEANRQSAARELALAATGGNVVKRIERLLYPKAAASRSWAPFALTLALIVAGSLSLAAGQSSQPSPYMKWVDEDVVYLITPEERTAYLKLATDPEREKFTEQFWRRRDPNWTPQSKMMEEHYRRIAYANQRFAGAAAGWRTDRGRMYIVYGPPDELESHPRGTADRRPWDDWMYHHVEGVGDRVFFTFVLESGEYRLAPSSGR